MKILDAYLHHLDEQVSVKKVGSLINNPEIKAIVTRIRNRQIDLAKLRKVTQTAETKSDISTKLLLLNADRKLLSAKLYSLKHSPEKFRKALEKNWKELDKINAVRKDRISNFSKLMK
jgi:hypothetical protein